MAKKQPWHKHKANRDNFSRHSTEKRWCLKLQCRGRLLSARGVGSRWEGRKWAKVKGPRSAGRCSSPPFTSSGSQPWQSKSSPTRSPLQDCSPCRCVKKAPLTNKLVQFSGIKSSACLKRDQASLKMRHINCHLSVTSDCKQRSAAIIVKPSLVTAGMLELETICLLILIT